jgi:hypothetical protein
MHASIAHRTAVGCYVVCARTACSLLQSFLFPVFFSVIMLCLGSLDALFPSDASNLNTSSTHAKALPASLRKCGSLLPLGLRMRRSLPIARLALPACLAPACSARAHAAVVDRRRRSAGPSHRLGRQNLCPRWPCPSSPPSRSRST